MKDLHQDRGGFVALIALALVIIFLVVLLLILFNDIQKLMDDLNRLTHPFGGSWLGSPDGLLRIGLRFVCPP
jgi:hypothetical protein